MQAPSSDWISEIRGLLFLLNLFNKELFPPHPHNRLPFDHLMRHDHLRQQGARFVELADQEGGGLSGQFLDVDVDGRQEWVGQGRKDGIVEADQRDVVRNFVLVQLQILQDTQS